MSQKSSKSRRFNVVDFFVLLIILLIAAMLFYMFFSPYREKLNASQSVEIEYTLTVSQLRSEFESLVKQGDPVTETDGLLEIGEIRSAKYAKILYTAADAEGGERGLYDPEYITLEMVVRAKASADSGLYKVNGYVIAPGKTVNMRVPGFTCTAECSAVRTVTEQ